MNIKIWMMLLFILPFFEVEAQQSIGKIEWGDEYIAPNKTTPVKTIIRPEGGFFVVREKIISNPNSRQRIYLEQYNENNKLRKSVELDLKYKNKQRDFEDVIRLGEELYLLSSYNNKAKKVNYLFQQKIGSKSLKPSQKLDMIASNQTINVVKEGSFRTNISTDSTYLLVYNQLPYKKKNPEQFALRVFDQNFELVWEKAITMPYTDEQLRIKEYRVDNKGNVFLLGELNNIGKVRNTMFPYNQIILAYRNNGENEEEYIIDLEESFITDLTFRVGNDDNLVCAGFFSDTGDYGIKGTCFFRINTTTKEIYNLNLKEFDFEFRTAFLPKGKLKKALAAENRGDAKNEPALYDYSLDDLILRSDGGAVLIAEQYYVYQTEFFDPWGWGMGVGAVGNRVQIDYHYNYNDIIVVNIRPDGEIEWTVRIPKRQQSINDGGAYSSYTRAILPTGLYFIYNDSDRNVGREGEDGPVNFLKGNTVLTAARIGKSGEVTFSPITSSFEGFVQPKLSRQISRNSISLYTSWNNRFQFGQLKFVK